MGDAAIELTAARRRALDVLAADGEARTSNQTSEAARTVYWQIADWLTKNGLATVQMDEAGEYVRLTDRGREVAADG